MPVIRTKEREASRPDLRGPLIDRLAKELMGDRTRNSPIIFEMQGGVGRSIDVVVIWDAWRPVSPGDRTSIIREAYARHDAELAGAVAAIDPGKPHSVPTVNVGSIAIGATFGEALAQGLLPYSIHSTSMPEEADVYGVAQLKREVGGIETPDGVELRFPDPQLAAEALDRLSQELPEARWEIVDESGRFDD